MPHHIPRDKLKQYLAPTTHLDFLLSFSTLTLIRTRLLPLQLKTSRKQCYHESLRRSANSLSISLSLSLYFSLSDSASGFSPILTPISTEHRLSSHFLAACADIPSLLAHHIHIVIFFCTSSFLWLLILTRSRQLSTINDTELTIFQFILISRSVLCSRFVDSHLPTRWTLHSLIGSSVVGSPALGAVNGVKTANPLR